MCQGSEYDTVIYAWVTQSSEYVWILLSIPRLWPSVFQTRAEHCWMFLNIPENPWIKLFWLCQGSQYASSSFIFERVLSVLSVLNILRFWIYHDIAITTLYNAIILEFLSARFVHPGSPQLTILSFFYHRLEHKNNVRAFKVFTWTAGCIFKGVFMRDSKNEVNQKHRKWIFKQKTFLYNVIFYQIFMLLSFWKFLLFPFEQVLWDLKFVLEVFI